MALNDYCYVIRSQANGDSFYVGQSTIPLSNIASFKNRMYTHALAACGVSGYGKTIKDFRSLEKVKKCDGIDKIWHDWGFGKNTFYIFNRPGVDTLQESAKMLLNYGFWAGVKSEDESSNNFSFSSGYSANIGEILLIDYFGKLHKSKALDSQMINTNAGGQGGTPVSYNPARSRWGRALLSNLDSETVKTIKSRWKDSYLKGGYKVSFTGAGAGHGSSNLTRLSNFLDNPKGDEPCYRATNNFIRDLVLVKLKQRIEDKTEIKNCVTNFITNENNVDSKGVAIIPFSPEVEKIIEKDLSDIESQLNQNSYISISFNLDAKKSGYKGKALTSIIKSYARKKGTITVKSASDVNKALSEWLHEAITEWMNNTKHYEIVFEVSINRFEFIGHESLYSTLEKEIKAVEATRDLTDIHTAIALGVVDALKYYIYHTPQDRKGILYSDYLGDQKVLQYKIGHDGDASYYNFLKSQIKGLGMFNGADLATWFDPLYKLAMKGYRETLGKKFITTTINNYTNNQSTTYLFSNTSTDSNYIPLMSSISMNYGGAEGKTLSDANNIYFIKGNSAISRWLSFESATPDLQKLIQVLF